MTIRENLEQWEKQYLSPYASYSTDSKGRMRPEPHCDVRPVFQRDRDQGRMPQVVPQGDGLHQLLVEPQCLCDGAGVLGDLQGMGQTGAVMIPLRGEEYGSTGSSWRRTCP